jgi:hypothetical protein
MVIVQLTIRSRSLGIAMNRYAASVIAHARNERGTPRLSTRGVLLWQHYALVAPYPIRDEKLGHSEPHAANAESGCATRLTSSYKAIPPKAGPSLHLSPTWSCP